MSKIKVVTDICMLLCVYLLMPYMLIDGKFHEIAGSMFFCFFIAHNLLNIKWYKNIFKGRYTIIRTLNTAVTFSCLISVLALIFSGIALSRYVFNGAMDSVALISISRGLHMASSYWSFILLSLHLGLHFHAPANAIFKRINISAPAIKGIVAVMSLYGLYAFNKNNFISYMFLESQFVFFDMDRPIFMFFAEYTGIMILFSAVAYYMRKLCLC